MRPWPPSSGPCHAYLATRSRRRTSPAADPRGLSCGAIRRALEKTTNDVVNSPGLLSPGRRTGDHLPCTGRTSTSTKDCCASAGRSSEPPRDWSSASPRRTSRAEPCRSPARPSTHSEHTGSDSRRNEPRRAPCGGATAWSSPRKSGHRSSLVTCCGDSSCSHSAPASRASICTLGGKLPPRGRHAHEGRPGAPGPLVVCHHRGHLQPRRSGPAAGGRGPARRCAPVVTVAVLRPRCCTGCCTHARGGSASSADPPLTCGFTVGLTGFEPAPP
jgi:hypothetical protein